MFHASHFKRYYLRLTIVLFALCTTEGQDAHQSLRNPYKPCAPGESDALTKMNTPDEIPSVTGGTQFCVNGFAAGFPCDSVDLQSFLNISDLGGPLGSSGAGFGLNDIWGWTSPDTGIEYALVGLRSGTAFVDISDPTNPILIGRLKAKNPFSKWYDLKTYKDHLFVVSESYYHGMYIYDLKELDMLSRNTPDMNLHGTAHYNGVGNSHNLAINEDTGFAYLVGTSTCRGGLHMVDITTPTEPKFVGCFSEDKYTHDAQCVSYKGPDADYVGREICFCCNEDTVTIVDVTDKANPSLISKLRYDFSRFTYTHQGWLSEDQSIFFMDDEIKAGPTTTYILDVSDLDEPSLRTQFCQEFQSSAHNQYVNGTLVYQANYHAGLRILDSVGLNNTDGNLEEIAFFDVYTKDNDFGFDGAWSNYPYFASGNVIVSSIMEGLFVVYPHFNYNSSVTVRHLDAVIVDEEPIQGKISQSMKVKITIHDHFNSPVDKAIVTGHFYNGIKKSTCITDSSGECFIQSKSIIGGINDISFSVKGVMLPRHRYESKNNNHSSIQIKKSGHKFDILKSRDVPKHLKTRSKLWAVKKLVQKFHASIQDREES